MQYLERYSQFLKSVLLKLQIQLGNGNRISFWKDNRVGQAPLAQLFPASFNASETKSLTVAQAFDSSSKHWNLGITRRVHDNVISDLATILHLLKTSNLRPNNTCDNRVWKDSHQEGEFSVKKCYFWLVQINTSAEEQSHVHPKRLWSKCWPPKVSFFLWSASKEKILTKDQLCKRGWKKDWVNHCYNCVNAEETSSHLLLHCSVASNVWNFFRVEFSLIWTVPHTISTALQTWPMSKKKSRKALVIKVLPVAILWSLWKERNNRAFNNKSLTLAKLIQKIRNRVTYWLYRQPKFHNVQLKDFMTKWNLTVFEPP